MSLRSLMTNYAEYNLWANETLVNWLKTKPQDIFQAEVPSSFPSILKTLNHIWAVEEFWHSVVAEEAPNGSRYGNQNPEIEEVCAGIIIESQVLHHYVSRLSEADLLQKVHLDTPWVSGEMPRFEFLQHVFNHSTYHRGQLVTIGRVLGLTDAPMTDYNYFNLARVARN